MSEKKRRTVPVMAIKPKYAEAIYAADPRLGADL